MKQMIWVFMSKKGKAMNIHRNIKLGVLWIGIVIVLLLNSWQAVAESSQPTIDTYIEEQMRELDIPGLAVAIVRGDQIEYVRGYGVADASGRAVTPQTPFLAASLSKSITAVGIMQLVEEGKVHLDDPIQAYLPWFQTADREASGRITVRHLLHHTSGFSQFEGDLRNLEKDRGKQALEASLRRLDKSELNANPGEQFEYSNTNYDLLGLLIQTVSGKPYETYIQQEIFAPLGMAHSYTTLEEAREEGLTSGHAAFFGQTIAFDRWMPYSRTVVPSAGLFLSAEDLARYLAVHLNEGRLPDGKQLLSSAGMAQLHTPGIQINENVSYAMGWTQVPFPQAVLEGRADDSIPMAQAHGGDWSNFKALMVIIPEYELGVAMLVNKQDWGQESAYDQIGWNTFLLALGLPLAEFPINEDFMTRYGRLVGGALVLLLAASLVWAARRLGASTGWDQQDPQRRQQFLIFLILLPLIDLALAGYVLLFDFESPATLRLELAFFPDAGLLYLGLLILTLGWGTLRTLLAARKLFFSQKTIPSAP